MVKTIKIVASFIAYIHCFFYILLVNVGVKYKTVSILISKWGGFYGIVLRRIFYKKTLNHCGVNLKVFYGAYICYRSVAIGNNCTIEEFCVISNCSIGNDVIIAANVSLMSGKNHHDVDQLDKTFYETQSEVIEKIKIGNNIWIGTHSVIMANIANGTVIGAGSVLNKNIDYDNMIFAGVPAKCIRARGC